MLYPAQSCALLEVGGVAYSTGFLLLINVNLNRVAQACVKITVIRERLRSKLGVSFEVEYTTVYFFFEINEILPDLFEDIDAIQSGHR